MSRIIGLVVWILLLGAVPGRTGRADEPAAYTDAQSLRQLFEPVQVGTDERFDLFKKNTGLRAEVEVPNDFRSILVSAPIPFQSLVLALEQDGKEVTALWTAQAPYDGELADARKWIAESIEQLGFKSVPGGQLPSSVLREAPLLEQRSREILHYQRTSGELREVLIVPLVDKNARPGSTVEVGLMWYVHAPLPKSPLTLNGVLEAFPAMKPQHIDEQLLKVLSAGTFERLETLQLPTDSAVPPRRLVPLTLNTGWNYRTSSDLRTQVKEVLESTGYVVSTEGRMKDIATENEAWSRDDFRDVVQLSFFSPPPRRGRSPRTSFRVSGRYLATAPVKRSE